MDKDMKKLIRALESQGFEIRFTTKGHVTVGRNALARLKRAGYRPPGNR
jgi:hypothetical protein